VSTPLLKSNDNTVLSRPSISPLYFSNFTMLSSFPTLLLALLASLASNVSAHGTMTGITGANGVQAIGMGVVTSTPRDGSSPVPFEVRIMIVNHGFII
jgi:hypothetical protein